MWIEERNGRFKYIERYTDPMTGKTKRVSVTLDKNTSQAQKIAQRALLEKIDAITAEDAPSDITLDQLIKLYLADQKHTVKPSTLKRNTFACRSIVRILGGSTLVDKMKAGYIRKALLSTGDSPGTLNERLTRLKALIRWGYRNEYLKNTASVDRLQLFKDTPHRVKIQDKYLEQSELHTLLAAMKHKEWHDLTLFLALSGLRFGEAAALELDDLHMKDRVISVTKNYDTNNDIVVSTKTDMSTREVHMQPELYELCKRLRRENLWRVAVQGSSPILFPGSIRQHIIYNTYRKYLQTVALDAIGRTITPHYLRHTHASLLMQSGVPIDTISRRLGHAGSQVTREIYLHVTQEVKRADNKELDAVSVI